ncbi:hypothetical protein [Marinospirillum alkaliphilum]|nr:hypothetical protein [Marinospirillum alkaliphilum]
MGLDWCILHFNFFCRTILASFAMNFNLGSHYTRVGSDLIGALARDKQVAAEHRWQCHLQSGGRQPGSERQPGNHQRPADRRHMNYLTAQVFMFIIGITLILARRTILNSIAQLEFSFSLEQQSRIENDSWKYKKNKGKPSGD